MGWFDYPDFIRVDPDRRQNRGNGPVINIPMTREEIYAKYGPLSNIRRTGGYLITQADVERVCKRKREKIKC